MITLTIFFPVKSMVRFMPAKDICSAGCQVRKCMAKRCTSMYCFHHEILGTNRLSTQLYNVASSILSCINLFINMTLGPNFKHHTLTNQCLVSGENRVLKQRHPKQQSIGVLKERCSENMQQIYWRTLISKCELYLHFTMGILL